MNKTAVLRAWRDDAKHAALEASILRRHDPAHPASVRAYQLASAYVTGMNVVLDALASSESLPEFLEALDSPGCELSQAFAPLDPAFRLHAEERVHTSVRCLVSYLSRHI